MKFNIQQLFKSFHPLSKLIFDVLIIMIVFAFTFLIGLKILSGVTNLGVRELVASSNSDGDLNLVRLTQMLYTFTLFVIPAFVVAFLYEKNVLNFLGLNKSAVPVNYLIIFWVMIFSLPVVNVLAMFNQSIPFPESLAGIETKFKEMEDSAGLLTQKILSVDSVSLMLLNLFMIALLPAIGEELFFRGIFQKHLIEWTKNEHIGIFIAAFIFSAFHFQFLTFIPRLFLGILLGYMYIWSKSLWLPIVAHFFNNAIAVVVMFFASKNKLAIDQSLDTLGTNSQTLVFTIFCLLFLVSTLYLVNRIEKQKQLIY